MASGRFHGKNIMKENMTIILLTNPDVILYKGTDAAMIAEEINDYRSLIASGILQRDRELIVIRNPRSKTLE